MYNTDWIIIDEEKIDTCEMVCPLCSQGCLVWVGCTYTYCPNCGAYIHQPSLNETRSNKWQKRKRKTYFVKCAVNMDSTIALSVIVKATNPHIAMQKAEAELRNDGWLHAKAFYCNEIK